MAFAGCVNLKELSIPKNVENIDRSAFLGTPSIKSIYISNKSKCEELKNDEVLIKAKFFKGSSPSLQIVRY